MKTLFFAVNQSQYRYFRFLSAQSRGESGVLYARRSWILSWGALKALDLTVFPPIIERKLIELMARGRARSSWSRACYRWLFYLMGIAAYLRYWQPIEESGAAVLAVWNGSFFRQAIACAIAEKLALRCEFFENGLLPGTTTLDGKGVNFANSVPRDPAFYAARPPAGAVPRELVPRAARYPSKFALKATPLPSRYVFVAFQLDHDTQITHFSPWIRNMEHLFAVVTAVFAQESPGFDLVFKEHPSAIKDYPAIYRLIERSPACTC